MQFRNKGRNNCVRHYTDQILKVICTKGPQIISNYDAIVNLIVRNIKPLTGHCFKDRTKLFFTSNRGHTPHIGILMLLMRLWESAETPS